MAIKIPTLRELMSAGVHFGHVAKYWHPKMAPYIFVKRDKIHVLNLEKTKEALEQILPQISQHIAAGKNLLLVGTKKQIRDITKSIAEETSMPYVDTRWLGGTLTNFEVIKSSLKRMAEIESLLASDEIKKYIKKERLNLERQLSRMKTKFGGLTGIQKLPAALFIIDPHYEKSAVKEARELGIEIYALADSNADPTLIDHLIPGNDDIRNSVALMMDLVKQAILEGQKGKK